MRNDIPRYIKKLEIFQDCVLKFSLRMFTLVKTAIENDDEKPNRFFRRICIIESDNELSLVHLRKVLVEHSRLRMSNM